MIDDLYDSFQYNYNNINNTHSYDDFYLNNILNLNKYSNFLPEFKNSISDDLLFDYDFNNNNI